VPSSVGRHRDTNFWRYRYCNCDDTFRYHDTMEYHDTDDDTLTCCLYFSLVQFSTICHWHIWFTYLCWTAVIIKVLDQGSEQQLGVFNCPKTTCCSTQYCCVWLYFFTILITVVSKHLYRPTLVPSLVKIWWRLYNNKQLEVALDRWTNRPHQQSPTSHQFCWPLVTAS